MQDHRSNLALVFFLVREQIMKLPILFFLWASDTIVYLQVFSRQKAIGVIGKAVAQGEAVVVPIHGLHKVLEQARWK
jgi:hypothetical protein